MTEIPEHLLARSKARRAALTGEGDAGAPATPAAASEATPAKAEAATAVATAPAPEVEKAPEPTPPWVEAAEKRKKVPFWVIPALVALPVFMLVYALTLDKPTNNNTPLALGATQFATTCAGCHGAGGGGGVGPQLSGGAVVQTFPRPVDQITWVALGSSGYQAAGASTYGAQNKPIKGGMPGQLDLLTPEQVMEVVLHERVDYGQEKFDYTKWSDGFEEAVRQKIPSKADQYIAVLNQWKTTSPVG